MQIRIRWFVSILAAYILGIMVFSSPVIAEQGLFIQLPSSTQIKNERKKTKAKKTKKKKVGRRKSRTYLPLPVSIERRNKLKKQEEEKKGKKKSKLILPFSIPLKQNSNKPRPISNQEQPQIADEVVITPSDNSDGSMLIEPDIDTGMSTPDNQRTQTEEGDLPMFPKDTSSAIFMIMKTWQCQDYNGNKLLQHATEVYGKEGDDSFQIVGLSEELPFKIDIDEEDITLDELLDIIAQKVHRNWGVDMQSKTIYFYPPAGV